MPDPLDDGDARQRRHHVDGGGQQLEIPDRRALGEDDPDREDHYPDRAGRKPDLALDPERLGPGTRVGDHQRAEHGDDAHRGGEVVAVAAK